MHIITRNFFALLRSGVLGRQETVEPMSAWKWEQAYRLAMVHGVEKETWAGVTMLSGQFAMRLTDGLHARWEKSALSPASALDGDTLPPRIAKRLAQMEEAADSSKMATLGLLRSMVALSQSLLTADRWVRRLSALAIHLTSKEALRIDGGQLAEWAADLHMETMAQLEGALLTTLLGIPRERLPLRLTLSDRERTQMVEEVVDTIAATTHQWQFSQGGNIFVHNSSSTAMYRQARHSVRYIKYHPTASIASFFSSFVQSLTNIEE